MPHLRSRYLTPFIEKALSYSPIVGVFGSRQVGKTSLLSRLTQEYVSLDRRVDRKSVEADPEGFISGRKHPFGIDECQLSADLFFSLKEHVRKRPEPGQFLLTGSVRYLSKKEIRESLTGRIVNLELLPLTLSESHDLELPNFLSIFEGTKIRFETFLHQAQSSRHSNRSLISYLHHGGLPGICFFRDPEIRSQKIESHLDTILSRDLKLVFPTTLEPYAITELLVVLAGGQGAPIEPSDIARRSKLSRPTLNKLLSALAALYLIRIHFTSGAGAKKQVVFFEDQGIATHLTGQSVQATHTREDLLRLIYSNLRQELVYSSKGRHSIAQFRASPTLRVDLVIQFGKTTLGLFPIHGARPTPADLRVSKPFFEAHPGASLAFVSWDGKPELLGQRLLSLPVGALV